MGLPKDYLHADPASTPPSEQEDLATIEGHALSHLVPQLVDAGWSVHIYRVTTYREFGRSLGDIVHVEAERHVETRHQKGATAAAAVAGLIHSTRRSVVAAQLRNGETIENV